MEAQLHDAGKYAAFPGKVCVGHAGGDETPIYEHPNGMSLRDYFAAKAIQGLLMAGKYPADKRYSKRAYQIADAMLAERAKLKP